MLIALEEADALSARGSRCCAPARITRGWVSDPAWRRDSRRPILYPFCRRS